MKQRVNRVATGQTNGTTILRLTDDTILIFSGGLWRARLTGDGAVIVTQIEGVLPIRPGGEATALWSWLATNAAECRDTSASDGGEE